MLLIQATNGRWVVYSKYPNLSFLLGQILLSKLSHCWLWCLLGGGEGTDLFTYLFFWYLLLVKNALFYPCVFSAPLIKRPVEAAQILQLFSFQKYLTWTSWGSKNFQWYLCHWIGYSLENLWPVLLDYLLWCPLLTSKKISNQIRAIKKMQAELSGAITRLDVFDGDFLLYSLRQRLCSPWGNSISA